jgi:hypothetical protein
MGKTHAHIANDLSCKKEGDLIFSTDFRGSGTEDAIRKALSRLARTGQIKRLAHGIYYKPKVDPVLGELRPGVDEVIGMLAQKEKIKVRPSGAYALHRLGLTKQVPTNLLYITNGHSKQFKLGKLQIKFKATSPKKLETIGEISSLLIQALEEIGTENIDPVTEMKILQLLLKEDLRKLNHDMSLAPAKVNDYIVRLLKKQENDRKAETNR